MAKNYVVNDMAKVHPGTRYGGKAQRSYDYYQNSDIDTLVERANKFLEKKHHSVRNIKKSTGTLCVQNIQWVTKRTKINRMVNCPCLADIVKKMMTGRSLLFNPLYKVLLRALNNPHVPPVARFCVIATGAGPRHKKETVTFIKVKIVNDEFVLPNSFLLDCSDAFLKNVSC